MAKTRRQFTPEEKHSILQEAEREGHTEACRKYTLASSVFLEKEIFVPRQGPQNLRRTIFTNPATS
jgi:hypothetical protein